MSVPDLDSCGVLARVDVGGSALGLTVRARLKPARFHVLFRFLLQIAKHTRRLGISDLRAAQQVVILPLAFEGAAFEFAVEAGWPRYAQLIGHAPITSVTESFEHGDMLEIRHCKRPKTVI